MSCPNSPAFYHAQAHLLRCLNLAGLKRSSHYSTGQVARILGVSRQTVANMSKPSHTSHLPCSYVGSHRRIAHLDLIHWIAASRHHVLSA